MPSGMLCWSKEKGFRFIQPDGGGEDVFFHVRVLKDGEGSVDAGNTAKSKISYDGMLAPSLTQTAKQSCESQARASAARSTMTRSGYCRGSRRYQITLVSGSNRAGAPTRPRRKRHQDTECRQSRSSHKVAGHVQRGMLGMDSAPKDLGSRGSRAQDDTKVTSRSESENLRRNLSSRES